MKRKLKRSLYCIVCVIILLSVSCIAAFADVPLKSAGVASLGTDFVTGPPIFARQDIRFDYFNNSGYDNFTVDMFLQAYLPADPSSVSDNYSLESSYYFDNPSGNSIRCYSSCSYNNFIYDNLTVAPHTEIVSGSVRSNFSNMFSISGSGYSTRQDRIIFTVRDFYCWSDASEVVFELNNPELEFYECHIYYSVNGSDEIIGHRFRSGVYQAYDDLHFSVINDYIPGASSSDVVYIHSWEVIVDNASNLEGNLTGYIEYNFNPNVRQIDINAGRPFDSENPAVPLLDYTAWIGTAVSGFLDLQIFPHFTLGGVLMTLLAFTCVIWFLKLVAGG